VQQYGHFADLVAASGADILWLEDRGDGLADAMFTHDPSLMTDHGAIILNMGKPLRQREPELHEEIYTRAGIPILGRIEAPARSRAATASGGPGDACHRPRGVRSNQAGIEQMTAMLAPHGITVLGFDLPLWQGEEACLHLMSVISPLADDLALVHAPLLPAAFYFLLKEKGIRLVLAPEEEFAASNGLNLNVLPTSPRKVIMVEGFPGTARAWRPPAARYRHSPPTRSAIACEGGPTCLTRPILRLAS